MGGVGPFVAGMVVGAVCVFLFVAMNAGRPERLLPTVIHMFQLMRLHLGRNSLIAASTTPHGWKISFHCFGCKGVTIVKPGTTEFRCDGCGKFFKQTGNDAGGSGVNAVDVTEASK